MPARTLPPLAAGPADMPGSGIREIAMIAMKDAGVIRLEIGQPDFPTPAHIGEAAKQAIDQDFTKYTATQGILPLREAIAAKLKRVNGFTAGTDAIVCGPGGAGAISAAFNALLEPGDEVLIPDPAWPNYRNMLTCLGVRSLNYRCPPEAGFLPDLEHIQSLITPRTKLLVANSPNNPTGVVYPRPVLEALADTALRHNLWFLSDECYDQIVFDARHISLASFLDDGRVVSAYTFSKTYAMTGWRLGYCVASPTVAGSITKVLESDSSCTSSISQRAALAALTGPQDCVATMVDAYRGRRDLVVELLRGAGQLIVVPQGAFYIMVDVSATGLGAYEFALRLVRERGVAVSPGSAFGDGAPGAVRVSLASSEEHLREGVGRLCTFTRELAAEGPAPSRAATAQPDA